MRKILVVCSGGLGTSLMLKIQVSKLIEDWGIHHVWIEQMDVGSASFTQADLIIGAKQVVDPLIGGDTEVVSLTYVADRQHVEEELHKSKAIQGWRSSV
ncbi:PTS sugar transporter subunit IIB [Alkalicoccobacillus porphyridii]|uniref:PTS sugar transporter subunit IIB n=1 Tax=Alkalicoccobacillus porphyridii TaxID=2597270 RepID=A0A554A486_9BACI|nr:PTS sugar transporter subunit IIB [Alkalicoccobacillus porphyridii]TSB48498.1 PTS sugar transporter subunit IIB [Alkalicoccobacillus porphyridii]